MGMQIVILMHIVQFSSMVDALISIPRYIYGSDSTTYTGRIKNLLLKQYH